LTVNVAEHTSAALAHGSPASPPQGSMHQEAELCFAWLRSGHTICVPLGVWTGHFVVSSQAMVHVPPACAFG
jgi:hypothetical protein